MSEQRFIVDDDGIYDNHEKRHFKFIAYDWIDCDIYECCEKLNEQQSTIFKLQDLCGESDGENARLRIVNKNLKEMNRQLKEINKDLGDDLHNCRLNKNIISEKLKLWQDTLAEYDIYTIKDFAKSFELDAKISKEKDGKIKELEVKVLNLELKNEELMKNDK